MNRICTSTLDLIILHNVDSSLSFVTWLTDMSATTSSSSSSCSLALLTFDGLLDSMDSRTVMLVTSDLWQSLNP